jgi:hypothetical protein
MATAETLQKGNDECAKLGAGSLKTGIAPCPLQACEPTSLTIQQLPDGRSAKERTYVLVAEGDPTRGADHVLQVLSDSSMPTVLKILVSGACANGKPSTSPHSKDASQRFRSNSTSACPAVAVDGPRCSVAQPSPVHIEVFPDTERIDKSFGGLIQHYLIPNAFHPAVYTVQAKKCGGNGKLAARVEVFPRIQVKGKLSLEYQPESKTKPGDKAWPLLLAGAIECQADGHEWKIGGNTDEFFPKAQRALRTWLNKLSTMNVPQPGVESNVKFEVQWPKIEFEASAANQAMEQAYAVDVESKFKLGCAPFIGAQIDIDILEFLCKSNALGTLLTRVRDEVKVGVNLGKNIVVKGEIKIGLAVTGEIAGGLEASKTLAQPWDYQGKIGGTIGVKLEAKIGAEVVAKTRWVEVKFGAGGLLELKGAERDAKSCDVSGEVKLVAKKPDGSAEAKYGLALEGAIKFNGAAIYFVAYYEVAVKAAESDSQRGKSKKLRGTSKDEEKPNILENKDKYEGVVVLCDPWSWPPPKDAGPPVAPAQPGVKPAPPVTSLHTALA